MTPILMERPISGRCGDPNIDGAANQWEVCCQLLSAVIAVTPQYHFRSDQASLV